MGSPKSGGVSQAAHVVLTVDAKVYDKYAFIFYGLGLVLLAGLFVFGSTKKGQALISKTTIS